MGWGECTDDERHEMVGTGDCCCGALLRRGGVGAGVAGGLGECADWDRERGRWVWREHAVCGAAVWDDGLDCADSAE